MVKWYHKGLWSLYSRFESWSASLHAGDTARRIMQMKATTPTVEPQTDTGRDTPRVAVAVLAAGHGTRMKSSSPKHIHPVGGVPLIQRILRAGQAVDPERLLAVVSPGMVEMPALLGMEGEFETVVQDPPRGTADAVRTALSEAGDVQYLVSLLGDNPLLTGEIVRQLLHHALATSARLTILTCRLEDAASYGRIHRNDVGQVVSIIEAKNDAPQHRQGPTEINSGIMVMDAAWARHALDRLPIDAGTQEYLLTDLVAMAAQEHEPGESWPIATVEASFEVSVGVNNRIQQAEADAIVRERVRQQLMLDGVTMIGPETIFIDETVTIGPDTVLLPGTVLLGETVIGRGCRIGPYAVIDNAVIGDNVTIRSSTISHSRMEDGSDAGPYAHIRGGTVIGPNAHVGNYAELKNAALGEGVKSGHVSYLGDVTIGAGTNIGAGTITANYDGKTKNPTVIGNGAFIGSDTVLVAPVNIGHDARTGAGSVVTKDVADGTTVVGVPARPFVPRASTAIGPNSNTDTDSNEG
jgi:bifunctional UDP-N-acetylglucosamine pyrophosphorylase/glucosamine-1-phosphate N-acetyltransferase